VVEIVEMMVVAEQHHVIIERVRGERRACSFSKRHRPGSILASRRVERRISQEAQTSVFE
jgi:hypothetical protein